MSAGIFFASFILGTIVGSFLNVVTIRYGARSFGGRSSCLSCRKSLAWYELVPILSFFAQGGRCRGCKTKISWQYPAVELLTGLVFVAIAYRELLEPVSFSPLSAYSLLLSAVLWSLLIAILVYDIRHKIIPDALVYSACGVALLLFLNAYYVLHTASLLDLAGGLLLSAPFAALWYFSQGKAMGLGDAKLIALFSPYLGFAQGLSALLFGFWIGAFLSILAILLKNFAGCAPGRLKGLKHIFKGLTMKTEMPLAPFLIAGLFIVYLCGFDVTGLGMLLQNS
jgi:prepilin signal peptidase PulO-like enzyme (type II secretory pathway)